MICFCGKKIVHRPRDSRKQRESRRFCSKACANSRQNSGQYKPGHVPTGRPRKIAIKVYKERKLPSTAYFVGDSRITGSSHHHWKGGKPRCLICSKQLSAYKVKHCRRHYGTALRQENHPNWKGGVSRDVHSVRTPAYKEWRNSVFQRDGWACRMGSDDCKGQLQAHHILRWADYPELRYEVNNGITLCQAHHPRKRAEEKRLVPTFRELVSVSSVNH